MELLEFIRNKFDLEFYFNNLVSQQLKDDLSEYNRYFFKK